MIHAPAGAAAPAMAFILENEADTRHLAQDIAALLSVGDLVALSGDLGVGKSVMARAMVRYLAGDPALEVPSPTFALRIDHDLAAMRIAHIDLYRLVDADEAIEIGLEEVLADGSALVEWPDRLPPLGAAARLDIAIRDLPDAAHAADRSDSRRRHVSLAGGPAWRARLARLQGVRRLLQRTGWADAERCHVTGDVSGRSYRRLRRGAQSRIVMDSPPRAEGPADCNGLSFEAATRRAMDVRPFVAIAGALRAGGFHAPQIHAEDLANGLLMLEDLGSDGIVDDEGNPISQRYEAAIDVLAAMHARSWPDSLALPDGGSYDLPPYDLRAYLAEVALFANRFAGARGRPPMDAGTRAGFLNAWAALLEPVAHRRDCWVLLDYHSPNLLWLAGDGGSPPAMARIGILDFQDALLGCCAYDVASLAQDARAPVSAELESALKRRYVSARKQADSHFDSDAFEITYCILATQRLTKVLGAFARLEQQGKERYAKYIPHALGVLKRNLRHKAMAPVQRYYEPYIRND